MKILIAEDDKVSRDLLREILTRDRSFEIKEAADGEEAWALLEQGLRPDLCILDIMMPNLDGLELLKRIRDDQRFKNTSVILCTALNDRTSVTQAAALSVSYFIIKPYTSKTVLDQVQKVKLRLGGPRRLESPSIVCERLGIGLSSYANLLRMLSDEVPVAIKSVEKGTAYGDLKTPLLKLNALKGAGMNLGANGLVGVVNAVEAELTTDAPSATALEADKQEQLCKWAALHHKRALDFMGVLKAENDFLISELGRLGRPAQAAASPAAPGQRVPQTGDKEVAP
jgi:two-component system, chemotaxis family, chemotaxis protein CheY